MLLKKSSIATGNATYRFAYHGDDVAVNQYDDDAFGNAGEEGRSGRRNGRRGLRRPALGQEERNDTGQWNRLLRSE
jgi:hypothetical protein